MGQNENKKNPDDILKSIQRTEESEKRGKLRIFLGMSAGVGKTYSMLKAAHKKKNENIDVVIGLVETHGRSETAALLDGFEIIPRIQINYRGTVLEEMNLDAILKRKPQLVIVDELAHSNIPGSRHPKRYQDILEILNAGMDVYTALNVQHLESRKESVETITGIAIRETVPDSMLEKAELVELVDIAPTELLKRLSEGKVYLGEKAQAAASGFFKEDRLTALREIALRMTAERVDQDLQRFSASKESQPWQTNERLLVAISHSPYSERLIRATRRLAYNLEAPWIAVHIDTGISLKSEDQVQLQKNINLARELGAEVITTADLDLPSAIQRISVQKNVTQIIVGKPTRRWFRDAVEGGSLLDKLVSETTDFDIHVIRSNELNLKRPTLLDEVLLYRTKSGWIKYYYAFLFLLFVSFIGYLVEPLIGYRTVGFIYFLAVLIMGLFGTMGSVFSFALLSALGWNFLFIPPKYTFVISSFEDVILSASYLVAALITGILTYRIRIHEKLIREREERTNVLYLVLQDISSSSSKYEFIQKVSERVSKLLDGVVCVLLKKENGNLDNIHNISFIDEKEMAVAMWAYQNQKIAGWSTETLGQSKAIHIPLKGSNQIVGVLAFKASRKARRLNPDQENLLMSIVGQLGLAIERKMLSQKIAETQRIKDSENLQQTLLNSISHELRTPLTTIIGSSTVLDSQLQENLEQNALVKQIMEASDRLNRVIENLLDMSRLSSGVLALSLEWNDISDLMGVVLAKNKKILSNAKVNINIDENVGLIRIDYRLIEHAISNILTNAALYAFVTNLEIDIRVYIKDERLMLEIRDNGVGIPKEYQNRIFEKFYRVPGSPTGGTGLGLSIVKNIVELHRGHIVYETVAPHGSCFKIDLPYEKQPELPKE